MTDPMTDPDPASPSSTSSQPSAGGSGAIPAGAEGAGPQGLPEGLPEGDAAFWDGGVGQAPAQAQQPTIPAAEVPEGFFTTASWMPRRFDAQRGALEFVKCEDADRLASSVLGDALEGETFSANIFGIVQAAIDAGFRGQPLGLLATTPQCPALGAPLVPGVEAPGLVGALAMAARVEARLNPRVLEVMVSVKRQMIGQRLPQSAGQQWLAAVQAMLLLLSRTHAEGARAVVVPNSGATAIAGDAMAALPIAKVVFVHEPLERFVARAMSSRVRRNAALGAASKVANELRAGGLLGKTNLAALPEHCRISLAWVAEMWVVHAVSNRMSDRVRTVAWDRVLDDPVAALGATAAFLELDFDNGSAQDAGRAVAALDDRGEVDAQVTEQRAVIDEAAAFVRQLHKRRPMPGKVAAPLLG